MPPEKESGSSVPPAGYEEIGLLSRQSRRRRGPSGDKGGRFACGRPWPPTNTGPSPAESRLRPGRPGGIPSSSSQRLEVGDEARDFGVGELEVWHVASGLEALRLLEPRCQLGAVVEERPGRQGPALGEVGEVRGDGRLFSECAQPAHVVALHAGQALERSQSRERERAARGRRGITLVPLPG